MSAKLATLTLHAVYAAAKIVSFQIVLQTADSFAKYRTGPVYLAATLVTGHHRVTNLAAHNAKTGTARTTSTFAKTAVWTHFMDQTATLPVTMRALITYVTIKLVIASKDARWGNMVICVNISALRFAF